MSKESKISDEQVDQALNAAEAIRKAPINEVKKILAPKREAAMKGLKEFEKAVNQYRPLFNKASELVNRIFQKTGRLPSRLKNLVDDAFRHSEGGVQAYKDILNRIDRLNVWEINQVNFLQSFGMNGIESNLGGLRRLAEQIEDEMGNEIERIKAAHPMSSVPSIPEAVASSPLSITDFDPRR